MAMKVGIVGLGVMGRNLALNARDGGCQVIVTDSWQAARNWAPRGIEIVDDHGALATALPSPRVVLLMVKAGDQVDVEIAALTPHLAAGETDAPITDRIALAMTVRNEDPQRIARDVLEGLKKTPADVVVELDRRAAIRMALHRAEPGDVVLIAGKGHETWQSLRERRIPFEDQRVVREELP
jgi:UDP-N-acetylmuramyl tripeptide synthase